MPSLWRSGGTRHAGRHQLFNHRTPVHGEVRSGFTRSIPIRRALERDRSAARIGGACGRHAHSRSVELGRCEGEGAGGHGRLLRGRRHAPGPRREVRGEGPAADDVVVPEEGNVGERQRPAHPGAAEHGRRLVQPRHRCVAGRPRLDQQHLPHQRPAGGRDDTRVRRPHGRVRPERAPGRVDRPVRRARRPQGRPGRVGGWPQRHDPGPDDRLPVVLLGPRCRDQLHRQGRRRPLRRRAVHRLVRAAVRSPERVCGSARVPGGRSDAGRRLDRRAAGDIQPGDADAPPRPRLRRRQVRAQCLDLRQHERQHDQLRQGALLADEERRGLGRHPPQGRVGRRQGEDSSTVRRRGSPPACSSRSRS